MQIKERKFTIIDFIGHWNDSMLNHNNRVCHHYIGGGGGLQSE